MKLYFLPILIILLTSFTHAQDAGIPVVIKDYRIETFQMNKDISTLAMDFEGALRDDQFGLLPVFIYRQKLESDNVSISAQLENIKTHLISDDRLEQIADINLINNDFQLLTSLLFIEGQAYAEVLVMPIRNDMSGQMEVLDSCSIILEISTTGTTSSRSREEFTEESVLSTGLWYRISTDEYGVYRIGYENLEEMGIDPSSLDPKKIRLFGNGNGIIPERNSDDRIDDLQENYIYVHGEDDGSFDQDDYILFYGESSITWQYKSFSNYSYFVHEINPYTDNTQYFLNINDAPGKRIPLAIDQGLSPNVTITEFSDYAVHEKDSENILKTGREWYGEKFGELNTYDFEFSFPNIVQNYKASVVSNVAARSTVKSSFDYYYGSDHLLNASVAKIVTGTTVYAWTTTPDSVGFYPTMGDNMTIRLVYDKPTTTSSGWLNYLAINARRKLTFTSPSVQFRDHLSYGPGNVAEYRLAGANDNLVVWDVTDPLTVTKIDGQLSGGIYTFVAEASEIRQYVAFDGSDYKSPEFIEEVSNQNLHAHFPVEYTILSHPDFMAQAERMKQLHQGISQMSCRIVTPQLIYNEFGSGKQDPSAIRDYMRMLYDRADPSNKPKYLLLLGDASYDYKDRLPGNTNYIPAYQSLEALKLGYSFVTDDYFGLMDPSEGANAYGKSVDIGIGRFPVHNQEQADEMVNKVETYLTMKPQVFGSWQNDICFIADDGDVNLHFTQAEKLQYMIDTGYQEYNRLKIYLDAFPQISTPSGDRYPDVNVAIYESVQKGCLIVNYTGHGGEGGWTHESVLDIPTINSWTNWDRLPLFITATCEFSRYDDPSMISAGEYVFLNPDGGGIGLLTTSRLAWADPNFRLNKAVYQYMFKRPNGEYYRLGDIMRLAKTEQNNGTNIKNFVLLGDPAMQLAYPDLTVKTMEINGQDVFIHPDTLTAMSHVSVKGMITDINGDPVNDFNGVLIPSVFDKDLILTTLGNDAGSNPTNFLAQGQCLFNGKVSVKEGEFNFNFFMPKGTTSYIGLGKISYFAYDTINHRDAQGYWRVKMGGLNPDATPDLQGPDLSLYLNNTNFVSGDITDAEPVFLAYLYDDQGINFTGIGIGREITLTLDGDPTTAVTLNSMYDPDLNSYQGGWVSYPLSGLADGKHTLTLKAWDNMDNASEKSIEFEVSVNGPIALTNVMNYPNPFADVTYFVFDHNKPGNNFDIIINIFDINGKLVNSLQGSSASEGLSISPLMWDGTNMVGSKIGNGVYVYRMHVSDDQGAQYVQTSKLIFSGNQ